MRKPAIYKHAPALAALATSILMVSCASDPVGAKEQTSMSAAIKDPALPFHDPAIAPLAEAVADGDVARIRALASPTNLPARGDDDVTLLEWAIWNRKPASLSALLEAGADVVTESLAPDRLLAELVLERYSEAAERVVVPSEVASV